MADVAAAAIALADAALAEQPRSSKSISSSKLLVKTVLNAVQRAIDAGLGTETKRSELSRLLECHEKLVAGKPEA